MECIYSCAVLSICAVASTKATDGICGMTARAQKQTTVEFKTKHYSKHLKDLQDVADNAVWSWMAWTYQERMLSRRVLIVSAEQVFWFCQCDAWMESTVAEPATSNAIGISHVPQ